MHTMRFGTEFWRFGAKLHSDLRQQSGSVNFSLVAVYVSFAISPTVLFWRFYSLGINLLPLRCILYLITTIISLFAHFFHIIILFYFIFSSSLVFLFIQENLSEIQQFNNFKCMNGRLIIILFESNAIHSCKLNCKISM